MWNPLVLCLWCAAWCWGLWCLQWDVSLSLSMSVGSCWYWLFYRWWTFIVVQSLTCMCTWAVNVSPQTCNKMVDAARHILNRCLVDIYINTDHRRRQQSGRSVQPSSSLTSARLSVSRKCQELPWDFSGTWLAGSWNWYCWSIIQTCQILGFLHYLLSILLSCLHVCYLWTGHQDLVWRWQRRQLVVRYCVLKRAHIHSALPSSDCLPTTLVQKPLYAYWQRYIKLVFLFVAFHQCYENRDATCPPAVTECVSASGMFMRSRSRPEMSHEL